MFALLILSRAGIWRGFPNRTARHRIEVVIVAVKFDIFTDGTPLGEEKGHLREGNDAVTERGPWDTTKV
jgi:hypothetical protein